MRFVSKLVCLFCWMVSVGGLRLVQYNAEWLFVDHYNGGVDCPGSGCTWKNVTEAETHLGYVSRVVGYLSPDIINFCEVEGTHELQMVANQTDPMYIPYLIPGTDTATGQNVGMLSRIRPLVPLYRTEAKYAYPIPNSTCGYTGSSSTGVSKHFITEFALWDLTVAFISVHFIAIPTDPSRCAQREAQATIIRNVAMDYMRKNYEVVVIGDMNDYDGTVLDVNGHVPLSSVLHILKGDNDIYELFSVMSQILPIERYSDWWDSDSNCATSSVADYSMIDHILVSGNILKYIENVFIYHGYAEFCGKYDSDHYPVVVDFY